MRTPHLIAAACTASDLDARYGHAESAVWEELHRSMSQHPRALASPEEAVMVLAEELDELWDEVRGDHIGLARVEATQVGAMAVRFTVDLVARGGTFGDRARTALADARGLRAVVGPRGRLLVSSHEGFGFLRREYDALWSAVRREQPASEFAARVAAMSQRFIAEVAGAPARMVRS